MQKMVLQGDEVQVQARFGPFGEGVILMQESTICVQRTIGSKIILDTPDGTPR
jgi:hypothetical protein